ncbi:hypothetical protein BJY52DRAFT_1230264 [Lactarius psammicola]|nr:hypothetical protein BJY52DRAFT_1230264 [Lactarius psammicola]
MAITPPHTPQCTTPVPWRRGPGLTQPYYTTPHVFSHNSYRSWQASYIHDRAAHIRRGLARGVAFSRVVPEAFLCCAVQAFGVIGDVYRPERRSGAMGVFFALATGFCGAALFAAVLLVFPETSWPGARGIDKLRVAVALLPAGHENPFAHISILHSPGVVAAACIAAYAMRLRGSGPSFTTLVLHRRTLQHQKRGCHWRLIASERTWERMYAFVSCEEPEYHITLASVGAMGATVAGLISDRILVGLKGIAEWTLGPRLCAAMLGVLILVPLSVLFSGMFTHFVPGATGLLMCLFVSRIGTEVILTPVAASNVDILHRRSAEAFVATRGSGCRRDRCYDLLDGLRATMDYHTLRRTDAPGQMWGIRLNQKAEGVGPRGLAGEVEALMGFLERQKWDTWTGCGR